MDTSTFLKLADTCLERVEDWLESFDPDELDYGSADGVLTLEFADGRKFVLNRQTATHQMWFAAGVRAWHYDWDAGSESWRSDRDGHELLDAIGKAVGEKLGRPVSLA